MQGRAPRPLLVLAVLPFVACQCDEATLIRVAPVIDVEAETIEFGDVPVGATKRVYLRVRNAGTADLTIIDSKAESPFGSDMIGEPIAAGQTALLDVSFAPTNDEPQAGDLLIESNDDANPMVTVKLTGQGVSGALTVQPSEVDFMETTIGVTSSVELIAENFGIETVEGDLAAEGFVRPEHFSLTNLSDFTVKGRFSVAPRGALLLDLDYRPLELGPDSGRIVFEVCGDRCGIEVSVAGTGSEAAVRLTPPVLDFGTMGIGDTGTLQLLIENLGNNPLDIERATAASSAPITLTPTRPLPHTLAPGESMGIAVELTADVAGEITGSVVVRTTDPVVPEARVAVVAQGEGPLFSVFPEQIAFGVVRDPVTHQRPLILLNSGSTNVQIRSVTIGGDPAFTLAELPGLPARLGAGESLQVNVRFAPQDIREYTGEVTVETNDPANAMVVVPVSGGLSDRICEVSTVPASINFGALPPTFKQRASATVTNIGTDVCTISSGAFRAPVDPTITMLTAPWPTVLGPGDAMRLDFEYAPVAQVQSKANLVLQTTDPVFPERHLSLIGTGQGYVDLFTDPMSIDFGAVEPMCALPARMFTLYNAGTIGVTLLSATITSSSGEFRMTQAPQLPTQLGPGGAIPFRVQYIPIDIGIDTTVVELSFAGLPFPILVPLQGEGELRPRAEQVFQQRRVDKVDVLFVIDDSCSMQDEQVALASNFQTFISSANVRQVDFQIGVTRTTLVPVPGAFVGPILTRNTPQLEMAFAAQVNVGVGGSGIERGLDAMTAALRAAERGQGFNQGFLRSGAVRSIVVISDEDDQSTDSPPYFFNEIRMRSPDGFTAIVVSGGPTGCSRNGQTAYSALRYAEFVNVTGGLAIDICDDWARTLNTIGQVAFGLRTSFALANAADQSQPIEVYVDGLPATGWMYDPQTASVVFVVAPPPGSEVRIVYTPDC